MTYQRLNALPEHSFYSNGRFPPNEASCGPTPACPRPPRGSWQDDQPAAAERLDLPDGPDHKPIPMVGDMDLNLQYQQPTEVSQQQIASVARHMWHYPPARREGVRITSVKVYRVKVHVLTPYELAKGKDPGVVLDRTVEHLHKMATDSPIGITNPATSGSRATDP